MLILDRKYVKSFLGKHGTLSYACQGASVHSVDVWRPVFDAVTFDCYGTLIDWESGQRQAFQDAMRKADQRPVSANNLLELC